MPTLHLGREETSAPKPRTLPTKRNLEDENHKKFQNPKTSKKRKQEETKTVEAQEALEIAEINVEATRENVEIATEPDDSEETAENQNKIDQPADVLQPPNPMTLLFEQIARNDKSVSVPVSWLRSNVSCNHQRGITFINLIGVKAKNGHIDSESHKKITVDESVTSCVFSTLRHIKIQRVYA